MTHFLCTLETKLSLNCTAESHLCLEKYTARVSTQKQLFGAATPARWRYQIGHPKQDAHIESARAWQFKYKDASKAVILGISKTSPATSQPPQEAWLDRDTSSGSPVMLAITCLTRLCVETSTRGNPWCRLRNGSHPQPMQHIGAVHHKRAERKGTHQIEVQSCSNCIPGSGEPIVSQETMGSATNFDFRHFPELSRTFPSNASLHRVCVPQSVKCRRVQILNRAESPEQVISGSAMSSLCAK